MLAGMATRVINFNPGPGALPLSTLAQAQRELLDFEGTGMSILEHSHRAQPYMRVHEEAIALLRELLDVPSTHRILLLQGGSHLQFAMLPMSFRSETHAGDYVITGNWARKAYAEAARVGRPAIAADVERQDGRFVRIPSQPELRLSPEAPYVHVTSNNTIFGTQYRDFPETGAVPLVADMSSDLLSRRLDVGRFGLIYAAAQKNLGPAGVTVVIIASDLLGRARTDIPEILQYGAHARENSLYNTAPTFSIYMLRSVLQWSKERGGVAALDAESGAKAQEQRVRDEELLPVAQHPGPRQRRHRPLQPVPAAALRAQRANPCRTAPAPRKLRCGAAMIPGLDDRRMSRVRTAGR